MLAQRHGARRAQCERGQRGGPLALGREARLTPLCHSCARAHRVKRSAAQQQQRRARGAQREVRAARRGALRVRAALFSTSSPDSLQGHGTHAPRTGADAVYSGLLECPCTDRITRHTGSAGKPTAAISGAHCAESISTAAACEAIGVFRLFHSIYMNQGAQPPRNNYNTSTHPYA